MAGFFNGLLRKPAKSSRIVYIFWLNNIFSKGEIGSTFMGPLTSEITFAKKKTISRSKSGLALARNEF